MSDSVIDIRKSFIRALLPPVLWLFVIPVIGIAFSKRVEAFIDEQVLEGVNRSIASDATMNDEQKDQARAFYEAMPPSKVCASADPELEKYRQAVCSVGSDLWQVMMADTASWFAAGLGLFGLVFATILGLLAFRGRSALYWTLIAARRVLTGVVVVEVVVQAVLATWLSFWLTAYFVERYYVKLILIVGAVAGFAAWTVIREIFRRLPDPSPIDAEVVEERDAPRLWQRVRELAGKLQTQPPRFLVAGIDANFFVTESGINVQQRLLDERVLYVSLSLLRVMESSEADAVLAHELAHFQGGDTAAGARLGPTQWAFDAYLHALSQSPAFPAYFLLRWFRAIYELASAKEQRERELKADAAAAQLTSANDLGKALLKVTAYASYRHATENELFEKRERHVEALGIKERVLRGLPAHVASAQFAQVLQSARMPHPFDSHPVLTERLAAVKSSVRPEDAASILNTLPEVTWVNDVMTAAAIEERLWTAYEQAFAKEHEASLAYRYLPATDEERVLVEKYFPPRDFPLKDGSVVRVTHSGVAIPQYEIPVIPFRDVSAISVEDALLGQVIKVVFTVGGEGKSQEAKIKTGQLGTGLEAFKEVIGGYWQRARVAQELHAQNGPPPT